jgi:pilus assembly protein CpaB
LDEHHARKAYRNYAIRWLTCHRRCRGDAYAGAKRRRERAKAYILATTMPLTQGTLLREQDVTWQGVTETKPGQVVRPTTAQLEAKPELENQLRASVYGAVLRHELAAGAPIEKDAIVKPGERDFLQVVLTPGQRAIAIPVATGGASTSLLSPGDRVDVVLTQNFKNDNDAKAPLTRRSVSETVVEDLRVLAIDAPDTKPVQAAANPATGNFGRIVTLEVTPEQAEQINVATELGKLSLTLRSAADYASASHTPSVSPFAPVVKAVAHEPVDGHVDGHVRPTWAGDVSPALLGAAQAKPVAVTPPPVVILRGSKPQQGHEPQTEVIETK